MGFENSFLVNLGVLITVAYLANVIYKYCFSKTKLWANYMLSVAIHIFAGWICMKFGFKLGDHVIFDLRFVPLIIASAVYSEPITLIIIGTGIGLSRLTFGIDEAAIIDLLNLIILGMISAGLNVRMRRSSYHLVTKGFVTILIINLANILNIGIFGTIPTHIYMMKIAPVTLPLNIGLSMVFALILRDFQLQRWQNLELITVNELLRKQTDELHKAKIILEERADQLTLASRYKSEFLANMSHELRTPLNSIINLAQIISENEETVDETSDYGRIIYKSGHELLQLINDILDLSKVEAGRLEISNEEVVLSELAELMQIHFEHLAAQKGLTFQIQSEEGLPETIISDPHRIGQILRNLLSNAFKFTHEGEIKLEIRTAAHGEVAQAEGEWIVFAVTDTGIGVPKDKHSAIFEAFQQADGSISRKYGGTGLGLPISDNLARLLGGFIRMQSKAGYGSSFSLYLPMSSQRIKEDDKVAYSILL